MAVARFLFLAWAIPNLVEGTPEIWRHKRTVSPDSSCGGSKGYTCPGTQCCSHYGWCDYCGTGCQSKFGSCAASSSTTTSTTKSQTPTPSSTSKSSVDGSCGGKAGLSCTGSSFGKCCSAYGWCGDSSAYCETGCQDKYGSCTGGGGSSSSVTSSSSTSSGVSSSSSGSSTTSSSSPTSTPATLTDCLGSKNVPIKLVTDADWNTYAATYNTRLQNTPKVIIIPTTQQHVQDAVVCAAAANVPVQAKSGGHSYASYSTPQNGMEIDLENFQDVSVDASGVATVGSGIRLGNLATAIYNQGQRALSHGTCPGVGIGGHFLHGGYGYSSRAWGLAMDNIIALDVVLASGKLVHCSSTENTDVYYAMRGAGSSIGIAVKFYLQTKPAPTSVVTWSYSFNGFMSDVNTAAAGLMHIQSFALNSSVVDRNLGFGMYTDMGNSLSITGTYFGDKNTFQSKIAPELLRTLPAPSSSEVNSVDWISSLQWLGGSSTITVAAHGYDKHDDFYAKSVVTPQSSPLTAAAWKSFINYVRQNASPGVSWFSIIDLYGGADSQVNVRDASFAAYSQRDTLWTFQNYAYVGGGAFPAAGFSFVEGLNTAVTGQMPGTAFGAYQNYVDPSLSASQAHQLYYGDALYSKLKTIKTAVDPQNVFSNPQSL